MKGDDSLEIRHSWGVGEGSVQARRVEATTIDDSRLLAKTACALVHVNRLGRSSPPT